MFRLETKVLRLTHCSSQREEINVDTPYCILKEDLFCCYIPPLTLFLAAIYKYIEWRL
jgi:hypothetical protein